MSENNLSGIIKQLLEEIRNLETKVEEVAKPIEESSKTIPSAADSLRDVIAYTEKSAHEVMSILDIMEKNSQIIKENVEFLLNLNPFNTIKEKLLIIKEKNDDNLSKFLDLYSAMSFQDLTSQQIKKVIEALEDTKKRLLMIVMNSINKEDISEEKKEKIIGKATEILTGDRINQDDVDALLAEFGL